jgi:non-heme Fe2+,alpha-ketoglutarate-dependent halogenase
MVKSMGRVLNDGQLARYHDDGVLFPVPALDAGALAAFRAGFDAVDLAIGGDRPPWRFGQWHLCFRWAFDLVIYPPILDAVEDLLGPDILVHSATAFVKHAHAPDFVSWHQDGYYWGLGARRLVSAWVALSESTPDSGCLRVVPGSHRRALVEHTVRHDEHNMLSTGLNVAAEVDEATAVDVRLSAGEMSFHHVDIIHGSGPNRSDSPRIGFAIRYTTPEVSQRRPHHEVVQARGSDRFGHYRVRVDPPGDSITEGLITQAALPSQQHAPQSSSSRRSLK